jgi:endonuclease G
VRTFQREAILSDSELAVEIAQRLSAIDGFSVSARQPGGRVAGRALDATRLRAALPQPAPPETAIAAVREGLNADFQTEAIIQRFGRPTLLVRNDSFELPPADTWRARLHPTKSKLDAAIRSVGRVEVAGSPNPFVGTAWMIGPNVAVTNRHVAIEFSRRKGKSFVFRSNPIGEALQPRVDFKEEHGQLSVFEASVAKVLFIAGLDDDAPDIAFLALEAPPGRKLPPPIPLFDGRPTAGQTVAVIGYPAQDPRNDLADQARLFGGIFDVKRLAPGQVMDRFNNEVFTHDCTTLGGSSGSVVVDVATGAAVGLHFAGEFLEANFAVNSRTLRRFLGKAGRTAVVVSPDAERPEPEGRVDAKALEGRRGF